MCVYANMRYAMKEKEKKVREEQEAGRRAVFKHEMEEWKEELARRYIHEVLIKESDDETEVKLTIHKHVDDVHEYRERLKKMGANY
jgi:hypothetical protein